ncbi:MAG TPA: c-type cytochrome [Methylophilaceae bacterium]|jgi:cytochrome c5
MPFDPIISSSRAFLLTVIMSLGLAGCGSEAGTATTAQDASAAAGGGGVQTAYRSGEAVYRQVCMACHASGVNDAPKFGDREAWAELIEEGHGILVYETIKGEGRMPPRGGDMTLTDLEMARAVAYMANAAGAGFIEPATEAEVRDMLERAAQEIVAHEAH